MPTNKSEIDWQALKRCALHKGELHAVHRPHVNSDRPLWVRWKDVPQTLKDDGYDYMTPTQTQVVSRIRQKSAEQSNAMFATLLDKFRQYVNPDYTEGQSNRIHSYAMPTPIKPIRPACLIYPFFRSIGSTA